MSINYTSNQPNSQSIHQPTNQPNRPINQQKRDKKEEEKKSQQKTDTETIFKWTIFLANDKRREVTVLELLTCVTHWTGAAQQQRPESPTITPPGREHVQLHPGDSSPRARPDISDTTPHHTHHAMDTPRSLPTIMAPGVFFFTHCACQGVWPEMSERVWACAAAAKVWGHKTSLSPDDVYLKMAACDSLRFLFNVIFLAVVGGGRGKDTRFGGWFYHRCSLWCIFHKILTDSCR